MSDLSVTYMGLRLKNPIVVASCGLTSNLESIKRLADNGAGAVVLKSLFEEQIQREVIEDLEKHLGPTWHYEAYDYVNRMGMELGPQEYIKVIENAKSSVSIPVIASLNCVSTHWWMDYAKKLQDAGADGLELNIAYLASDLTMGSSDIEHNYYRILQKIKGSVNLPVAVKLGPFFTSLAQVGNELCRRGADALVLFNRFYRFDIDIERMKIRAGNPLSTPAESNLSLKWISLLFGRVNCDLVATTGIHDGKTVIKQVLAGAQVVQVCSVLYSKDVEIIGKMLDEIDNWMKRHEIDSLDQIRGKLSQQKSKNPELYERIQYIKALVGIE